MEYFFTIECKLDGFEVEQAKQYFQTSAFHEHICRKLPCTDLDIQRSDLVGDYYYLERAYNLDLDMPGPIRNLLKGAFRLQRHDYWNFSSLTASSTLRSTLPGILSYHTFLKEVDNSIQVQQKWKLDIGIPLLHKTLAKFAESEIRKFFAIEMDIIQKELIAVSKV